MINEARVKLMTRLASFEQTEGKKSTAIGTYFKSDYIWKEIIKSVIYATLTFFIIVGLYICYDFEFIMNDIYGMDLMEFGKKVLLGYLELVLGYGVITFIVYSMRYTKARNNLRRYYNNLRRLHQMYRKEDEALGRDQE